MTIVGDVNGTLRTLYGNSEFLFQREINHCSLDPGGMVCMSAPYFEFQIEGNGFGIKSDQIEPMLLLWKKATITSALAQVPMWMRVLVLPESMYLQIGKKLEALHTSDVALHAELAREEIFQKLDSSGHFLRKAPPTEGPSP